MNVVNRRKEQGKAVPEETYHVLGVIFAEDEVKVHGYSRLLTATGESPAAFLDAIKKDCNRYPIRDYAIERFTPSRQNSRRTTTSSISTWKKPGMNAGYPQ